ncbi:MAG TPA: tetratricopeptide repeat protein [Phycisphaerae bacterium]|nr:tetratricopeptide repeat protein [Phycisphaerae bacterium]
MRLVLGISSLAVLVMVCPPTVRAAAAAADPFYQGLESRGLRTLMEAYLKQKGAAATQATPGVTPAESNNLALARLQVENARQAKNMAAPRDTAFQNARKLYEGAIADSGKALAAIPADQVEKVNEARRALMNVRLELANMIFQQWLRDDLEFLEVTDRRGGNRERATELLGVANEQYTTTIRDTEVWLSTLDQLPEDQRRTYVNTGQTRAVRGVQRDAKFANAWVTYYYGWILPKDYKPPKGKRTRDQILGDAITAFQAYVDMPDRVRAKWQAHMATGMAYRELGKFKEALQTFAMANPPPTDPNASDRVKQAEAWKDQVRIQVAYERAVTLMRKGDHAGARKAIDEASKKYKDTLGTSLYGLAMPLVAAESYVLEGTADNKQGLKDKGMAIFMGVHKRDNPWPVLVQWIMKELLGETPDVERAPFQLWIDANDALREAQDTEKADVMRRAADLFKTYIDKVGPEDANYPDALYARAYCLLRLVEEAEAAKLYQTLADGFPKYKYAAAAAGYAVKVAGDVYEKEQTEPNRLAYEKALRWFISKWGQADPDQQYFLALILYRGKDFTNAADAFTRVPEAADHYVDSKYWVPLCRLEHFRERILPSRDPQLTLSGARVVAQALLAYADYAFSVQNSDLPDEKKKQLLDWAEGAYVNAADVYLYQEVNLAADALPILDATEKKFKLSEETLGNVLKLRIDALTKLGRLDEARQVLDRFLTVADPAKVGPVLRGLFAAMTDEVRSLIKRQQTKVAGVKVEQAKVLGDRYLEWLEKSQVPNKAVQIENSRYDLAELYLAVRNYGGALQIYRDIGGLDPHKAEKGKPLREDCIYGQARAFQGMGDAETEPAQAKPNYEAALDRWRVLRQVENVQPDDWWERTYNLHYCKYKLGDTKDVRDNITAVELMKGTPKDPLLQQKWRELKAAVAGTD